MGDKTGFVRPSHICHFVISYIVKISQKHNVFYPRAYSIELNSAHLNYGDGHDSL